MSATKYHISITPQANGAAVMSEVRKELLDIAWGRLSPYQLSPKNGYDYAFARHHLIFSALTQGVQYVYNASVEGDVADFGTAYGFTSSTLARAMGFYRQHYAGYLQIHGLPDKNLFLLDSFEGLPEPKNPIDLQSPNISSGRWKAGTFKHLNKAELFEVCRRFYDDDKIKIVEGWYSESLKKIPLQTKFALMHVDCDIYSSTVEVLDHVFLNHHVSDGCAIFFDDWNCNRASPKFGQRKAWGEMVEKHKIEFSDCGEYGILGRKFIIHRDS